MCSVAIAEPGVFLTAPQEGWLYFNFSPVDVAEYGQPLPNTDF